MSAPTSVIVTTSFQNFDQSNQSMTVRSKCAGNKFVNKVGQAAVLLRWNEAFIS